MAQGFRSILQAFRVKFEQEAVDWYQLAFPQNGDASVDRQGNLWVRDSGGAPLVPPAPLASKWIYQAVPGDDTAVIRATANNTLTQVGGFNDSGANIYVQLHNTAAAIAAAAAPVMTFFVPMNASFSWNPSQNGRVFSTGIAFGVSSTRDTYTALVTPIFLFAEGFL